MTAYSTLLQESEAYIRQYFADKMPEKYVFHDLEHTLQTVAAVKVIGEGYELSERELCLLQLSMFFHDTGYTEGPPDHEERGCIVADHFFKGKLDAPDLDVIMGCIRATKVPQDPHNLYQKICCDADLSHLGMDIYWDRTGKLRQEFILARQNVMSEQDWVDFELSFMLQHEYHTEVAREMFNKRKSKHIQQLIKQRRRLNPEKAPTMSDLALLDDKEKVGSVRNALRETEDELRVARLGRGVETMYRTTYRTHTNLSTMADSKANLMLSVSALVISIVVSNLLPKLLVNGKLDVRMAIPTAILTGTCLIAMVYATLSTRPKVTEGKVTREAIKQRKANLLFFGNFHSMPLEEFQWGVNEMLKDPEFLYSSMSRDLYFLGIVLAKKYQYLSICYSIFMYGLIISVLAFVIAFSI
jgi:predicted metal-dependent HD superfamily phosphohydrolase